MFQKIQGKDIGVNLSEILPNWCMVFGARLGKPALKDSLEELTGRIMNSYKVATNKPKREKLPRVEAIHLLGSYKITA